MLRTRLITAALGIPILIGVIWAGGWWLTGVVAGAAAIAVIEIIWARLGRDPAVTSSDGPTSAGAVSILGVSVPVARASIVTGGVLAAILPIAAKLGFEETTWAIAAVALLPVALMAFTNDPPRAGEAWLWTVAPVVYIGGLSAYFVVLRGVPDGREWLLLVVLTVWITDTGAYFVGRVIGKHKMAPAVSPGKTWEGAVAGEVSGFAAVAGLQAAFGLDLSVAAIVGLGLLVPTVGQLGDLAESALKRGLGVKDSSGLVPGHGGIADRLDSLLFAAPAVYYFIRWLL